MTVIAEMVIRFMAEKGYNLGSTELIDLDIKLRREIQERQIELELIEYILNQKRPVNT